MGHPRARILRDQDIYIYHGAPYTHACWTLCRPQHDNTADFVVMAADMAQEDANDIQAMTVDQSSDGINNTSEPETIRPEIGRAPCYVVSASTGPAVTHVPTSPGALRQELGDVSTLGTDTKCLVVVHGLPTAYVQVLSDELGMDPDFVRAVASRRRFKPKQGRQEHGLMTVVSFEYPLLLGSGCSGPLYDNNADYDDIYGQAGDEMEKPLVCPTSSSGSDGVVFCRVAAWQCEKKTGELATKSYLRKTVD